MGNKSKKKQKKVCPECGSKNFVLLTQDKKRIVHGQQVIITNKSMMCLDCEYVDESKFKKNNFGSDLDGDW